MAEQVSRRSFFKLLGGAVALAAAPSTVIAKAAEVSAEFGWTWYIKNHGSVPPDSEFSKLIRKTLAENAPMLRDNVSRNNALFLKLKNGQKAKINIEYISPDEQTKRMAERMTVRLESKSKPLEKFPEMFGDVNNLKTPEEHARFTPRYTEEEFNNRGFKVK